MNILFTQLEMARRWPQDGPKQVQDGPKRLKMASRRTQQFQGFQVASEATGTKFRSFLTSEPTWMHGKKNNALIAWFRTSPQQNPGPFNADYWGSGGGVPPCRNEAQAWEPLHPLPRIYIYIYICTCMCMCGCVSVCM